MRDLVENVQTSSAQMYYKNSKKRGSLTFLNMQSPQDFLFIPDFTEKFREIKIAQDRSIVSLKIVFSKKVQTIFDHHKS